MGEDNLFVWRDEYPEGFQYPGREELPVSRNRDIAEGYRSHLEDSFSRIKQEPVPGDLIDDFMELEDADENPYPVFDEYPELEETVFSAISKSWFRRILVEEDVGDRLEGNPSDYLESHMLSASGTREGAKKALEQEKDVFHNGGGHHHAARGGSVKTPFNLINDQASAIEYVKDELEDPDILVVDLDLHFGDGTVSIYCADPHVTHFSMHQWNNFPQKDSGWWDYTGGGRAEGQTVNMPLPDGLGGEQYLSFLDHLIEPVVEKSDPDLTIYQAGTDPHHADPEGELNLTMDDLYRRDRKVFEEVESPVVTVTGGGYGPKAAEASVNTMAAMADEEKVFEEEGLDKEEKMNAEAAEDDADRWFNDLLEYDGHRFIQG